MSPKCNMWMTTFRSNWFCYKKCKISSTPSANRTSLQLFSSPTSRPKTGFSVLKPWRTLRRNTPKEPSFSTTSPIVHWNHRFTTLFLKHVSTANLQTPFSTCSLNNALIASPIKNLISTKGSANPNPITPILPNLSTGTSMAVVSLKSTKTLLHVPMKNPTLMESFVFPVTSLTTGAFLQIFAKNVKVDFHSIRTLKTAKKSSSMNSLFYKIPNGFLKTSQKYSKIGQKFSRKTKLQATISTVLTKPAHTMMEQHAFLANILTLMF